MLLKLANIDAYYGSAQALHDVDIEVAEGDIVGLLGSNGAGKTTTLKTISGLLRPRRGKVWFKDTDITDLRPPDLLARGVVHVPEGRHVFPQMTVKENLLAGAYARAAWKTRRRAVSDAFTMFPRLGERAKQLAGSLSGGEQQMLAIARGLVTRPTLLLLDEPTLGLAPVVVDRIFDAIRRVHETGCTVVIVEQNMRALELFEHAYIIDTGKIVFSGSRTQLQSDDHLRRAYLGIR